MLCAWCQLPIVGQRTDSKYHSRKCRQAAWRTRQAAVLRESNAQPKRIAYADPPYPGRAWMYKDQPSYAGEVDFPALIASLRSSYDGWALSTSEDSLRWLLPLCPEGVHVCPWHKPHAAQATTYGMHNVWEPVIVWPARELRPGIPDALRALPARGGGDLIGRKPLKFCAWLFGLLGAQPGDDFVDLFPGTGVVGRAWSAFVSPLQRHVFAGAERHASPEALGDPSCAAAVDASSAAPRDGSPRGISDACADGTSDAFRAAHSDASARATDDASRPGAADASVVRDVVSDMCRGSSGDTCSPSTSDTFRQDLADACEEYSGDAC